MLIRLLIAIGIFFVFIFDIAILFYYKDESKGDNTRFTKAVLVWLFANATFLYLTHWVIYDRWLGV